MRRVKVLFFDPSGSVGPYLRSLTNELDKVSEGVTITSLSEMPQSRWKHRNFYPKCLETRKGIVVKFIKVMLYPCCLLTMHRFLVKQNINVVHLQWIDLPIAWWVYFFFLRSGIKRVITVHNSDFGHGIKTWKLRLQSFGYVRLLSKADSIVCHTENAKSRLALLGCDKSKIKVIPHAPISLGDDGDVIKNIADKHYHFSHLGILTRYKGTEVFLDSLKYLDDYLSDDGNIGGVNILIAGRPDLAMLGAINRFSQQTFKKINVAIMPYYLDDDEFFNALSSTQRLVLPYKNIDASGILNAALQHGVSCVVSELSEFRVVLGSAAAAYVDQENPISIAQAMFNLVKSGNLEEESNRVSLVLSESFTWKEAAKATFLEYQ